MTHKRRSKGKASSKITFTEDTTLSMNKDLFLANPHNKQAFIKLLANALVTSSCTVFHAESDADLLICLKTIKSAVTMPTVLIGDDTDLLVLLIHHADLASKDIYYFPINKSRKIKGWRKSHVTYLQCSKL